MSIRTRQIVIEYRASSIEYPVFGLQQKSKRDTDSTLPKSGRGAAW